MAHEATFSAKKHYQADQQDAFDHCHLFVPIFHVYRAKGTRELLNFQVLPRGVTIISLYKVITFSDIFAQ